MKRLASVNIGRGRRYTPWSENLHLEFANPAPENWTITRMLPEEWWDGPGTGPNLSGGLGLGRERYLAHDPPGNDKHLIGRSRRPGY